MPTGYTADVQSGKVTEFRDFAMQCARAFGACITMRDDPSDAPIPEKFEPAPYYANALKEAEAELERLRVMTIDQQDVAAREHNDLELASWRSREDERVLQRHRYEVMLEKAKAWTAPTEDHVKFREFMISQLSESIEWDCGRSSPQPTPLKRSEWYSKAIADAMLRVARYEEEVEKEIERANDRTAWVKALRDSLLESAPS